MNCPRSMHDVRQKTPDNLMTGGMARNRPIAQCAIFRSVALPCSGLEKEIHTAGISGEQIDDDGLSGAQQ
jgi:hypothetical protein